jgi:diacylglycerol kinase family enzyme
MPDDSKKIAFLINPVSGSAAVRKKGVAMVEALKSMSGYSVFETQSAAEMLEITKHLAQKNYRAVFACGGDGTLNLVSSWWQLKPVWASFQWVRAMAMRDITIYH